MAKSRLFREIGVLLGLTLVAGLITLWLHPKAPAWRLKRALENDPWRVTLEAVEERWQGEVLWIDTRSTAKFEAGHWPGALLLNRENWNDLLLQHFDTLTSALKPIVVYCDTPNCQKSREIAEELRDLGIGEVFYLPGGWAAMQAKVPVAP